MLFHRLGTLSHILASTELTCCSKKDEFLSDEALIEKNAVEIVKQVNHLYFLQGDFSHQYLFSIMLCRCKNYVA